MDVSVLDNKISKNNQMRMVIGLLCIKILHTILISLFPDASGDSWSLQKIFFNLSNVLIFLYLYKFVRYDLKLQLFFAFISIEVLINLYFVVLMLYKVIQGMGIGDRVFGGYEQTYPFMVGISLLRFVAIIGVAIQLLLNKYFNKKIKMAIQILGGSLILQYVGGIAIVPLIGMLNGTTVEVSVVDTMYRLTYLFFDILPYLSMVYLYVLTLDQNDADTSIEKEL